MVHIGWRHVVYTLEPKILPLHIASFPRNALELVKAYAEWQFPLMEAKLRLCLDSVTR